MNTTYTHISTIDALTDFVHALAFSKDGRYLASASNDRVVRVHDVKHEFATIWELQGNHPFTALAWRDGGLFMGNMDGDLTLSHPTTKSKLKWIRRRHSEFELVYKSNEPIHVMEFNRRGDHLLVCSGADVMLLKKSKSRIWQYHDRLPHPIPLGESEDKSPPIVATGAYFLESRNECLIAYLHDGFRIFKIDTWENIRICGSDERLYEKIAASAISPDLTFIIATNLHKGLDWYKIMPDKLKKMSTSCEIQSPGSNIPLPVLFINNGQAAIMGTSKGYAVIFEAKHGKRVQALKHGGDQTWVTALAYAEPENGCRMIATGDGNCGERTRILIWTENFKDSSSRVSKLQFALFKIVHVVTNAGYIIFLLMGIVLAMSLSFPTPWTEMDRSGLLEYLAKLSVPTTPPPPPTPVVRCAGPSGSSTSIKEILIGLGDLLMKVPGLAFVSGFSMDNASMVEDHSDSESWMTVDSDDAQAPQGPTQTNPLPSNPQNPQPSQMTPQMPPPPQVSPGSPIHAPPQPQNSFSVLYSSQNTSYGPVQTPALPAPPSQAPPPQAPPPQAPPPQAPPPQTPPPQTPPPQTPPLQTPPPRTPPPGDHEMVDIDATPRFYTGFRNQMPQQPPSPTVQKSKKRRVHEDTQPGPSQRPGSAQPRAQSGSQSHDQSPVDILQNLFNNQTKMMAEIYARLQQSNDDILRKQDQKIDTVAKSLDLNAEILSRIGETLDMMSGNRKEQRRNTHGTSRTQRNDSEDSTMNEGSRPAHNNNNANGDRGQDKGEDNDEVEGDGGGDGDDERHPSDDIPNRSQKSQHHSGEVKRRPLQELKEKELIREWLNEIMEGQDLLAEVVTKEEAEEFAQTFKNNPLARPCSTDNFRYWIADILVKKKLVPDLDIQARDALHKAFFVRLKSLHTCWQDKQKMAEDSDKTPCSLFSKRWQRKNTLFHQRRDVLVTFYSLQPFLGTFDDLGIAGMSSDEEDPGMKKPRVQYIIKEPKWRSVELKNHLRLIDYCHLEGRCTTDQLHFSFSRGSPPRLRVDRNDKTSKSKYVRGLPANFYDAQWLEEQEPGWSKGGSGFVNELIRPKKPVKLVFPPDLMKTLQQRGYTQAQGTA
ncbi:hypothetical protein EV368DRAFT_79297 [Lentinula lateritia]|nr:hypothetical protein EV368DRAFT_79297 [Lentinula lateritia]